MNDSDKICIITGATSGIGRETALALAGKGMKLVLPVRNLEKGAALKKEIFEATGNPDVDIMFCDLSSLQSVRQFANEFLLKYSRLDVLINNAGIWDTSRNETQDGIERTFAVNHLAPFLLTQLLLDRLITSAPSRVINVSSEAHRQAKMHFEDIEGKTKWSSFGSYAQSKLANILFTKELARKLNGAEVTVNSLHPGVVNTALFDQFPRFLSAVFRLIMTTPKQGAQTSVYLATSPDVQTTTSTYFSKSKAKKAASRANDDAAAKKLWEISMEYVNNNK